MRHSYCMHSNGALNDPQQTRDVTKLENIRIRQMQIFNLQFFE